MPYVGPILAGENADVDTGAEQLTTTSTYVSFVVIQADPDNTGDVFVGDVNGQFVQLTPGQSVGLAVKNLNEVYVKGSANNQAVNYVAIE